MSGERILVVDDSKENRDFIVDYILKPNGFEPIQARDGVEGIELARQYSPDLILLDLQMPRLDGTGVLNALRQENLNIPVILMTFHGSEEVAVDVFRLGVRDYVKKPYTTEEMLSAIEGNLTETRLRKEKEALTSRLLNANRELHSRVKELNTLYSIGKSVTALLNPTQLLARVVEAATTMTNAEQGSLSLVEGDHLVLRAVKRRGEPHAHPIAEANPDKVAERAIKTGKSVILTPPELASLKERNPNAPTAVLVVPMIVSERIIGALGIENISTTQAFTDHEGALLAVLGDYAAIAIENARNFQRLEEVKERETMAIRGAFERFVAPGIVNYALSNPAEPVGGQRRTISVLFASIRGAASITEQDAPEQVLEILNGYMKLVAETVFPREGMLEKFPAGMMAYFNAPKDQGDHASRAVETALALQAAVAEHNKLHSSDALNFSIGLNVGSAVVGSLGAPGAMSYTAVGDAVNVARQLSERAEPGQILAEESTIKQLGAGVNADRVGEVQIAGSAAPVVIYALHRLT